MARRRGGLVAAPRRGLTEILRSWQPSYGWVTDGARNSYDGIGSIGASYPLNNFAPSQTSEVTVLNFANVTGGTFTLTIAGYGTTAPISWSSTSATLWANVDAAVEAIPGIGAGQVSCSTIDMGSGLGAMYILFNGSLPVYGIDFSITGDGSGLTGSSPVLTVATLTDGGSAFSNVSGVMGLSAVRGSQGRYMVTPTSPLPPAFSSTITVAALVRPVYPAKDGIVGPIGPASAALGQYLIARRPSSAHASWVLLIGTTGICQMFAYDTVGGTYSAANAGSGSAADIRFDGRWKWVFGTIEEGVGTTCRVIGKGVSLSGTGGVAGTLSKLATGQVTMYNQGRVQLGFVGDGQAGLVWNDRLLTVGEMETIAAQTLVGV